MKNLANCVENLTGTCSRQASRQKSAVPLVIIAIIAMIGLLTIACDDGGDGNVGDYDTVISVDQLPEFPSGSTPAETKADAEAVLAKLRQTDIIHSIRNEIQNVVRENRPDSGNYNLNNLSLPDGFVRVSANVSRNETNTGGLKKLYEDDEEEDNIHFARGDISSGSWNGINQGELIRDKTEGSVTIAKGSIFEEKYNDNWNYIVSTAGNYATFRINNTYSGKEQSINAFTVTTSSGSVKVILYVNFEESGTGNNVLYRDDSGITEISKLSGSLKVYGNNNTLLIDHPVVDEASWEMARGMIGWLG